MTRPWWLLCLLASTILSARIAHADVGVALADPTHVGASVWTQAGHASVYLSGVCAETPVKLRLCRPGEQGSIVSAFPNFDENKPYEWNAVPLELYLYGSSAENGVPVYASPVLKRAQNSWAAQHWLRSVCQGACPETEHAFWRDMVAATTARDLYVFAVRTTREQDQAFIDRINAMQNRNRYHTLTYNCANFVRDLIGMYFPHSVHRDLLNDLGMMAPKSAARSLTHYAEHRPELGLYVLHFTQQPGVMPRSGTARAGTETAFHEPKYLVPAALIGDHEVAGAFFVAYFLTGRFGLQHTYEHFAAMPNSPETGAAVVGSRQEWRLYRQRFAEAVSDAVGDGTLRDKRELSEVFKTLDRETIPAIDPAGHAWLVWRPGTKEERRVGVDWSNVQAPESDAILARRLVLARMGAELRGPAKARPTLAVFGQEWALLESLQHELIARSAR